MEIVDLTTTPALDHIVEEIDGMHAHQHGGIAGQVPLYQHQVLNTRSGVDVNMRLEDATVAAFYGRGMTTRHHLLAATPVSDQISHRDNPKTVDSRESFNLVTSRDTAIIVENATYDACLLQSGETRRVDGRLCVSSTRQNPAILSRYWKHMAWRTEIARACAWVYGNGYGCSSICRRYPGRNAPGRLYRDCEPGVRP